MDLDDPIAKREKQEAQRFLADTSDNAVFARQEESKDSKEEMKDLLSVLDTVQTKLNKKYKK